jgi:hypothetical protein
MPLVHTSAAARENSPTMSAYLEQRLARLNEEIRCYPGPIARCDEHLPALLEDRARLLSQLENEKQGCSAEALWANDGGCNAA